MVHKSFHRYVVRAVNGHRQMNHNNRLGNHGTNRHGTHTSHGVQLRQYNEEKHRREIEGLLTLWFDMLTRVAIIYLQAPGRNRQWFFFDRGPLIKVHIISFICATAAAAAPAV